MGIVDGWMNEEDEEDELFLFFFFCGLGWVRLVGGSILALICFFAYKVPTSYVFCVFSFGLFGGRIVVVPYLLIDLIERLARPIFRN